MIESYGYGGSDELVRFDDLSEKMKSKLVDDFLIS